jgi:hypothetical protein
MCKPVHVQKRPFGSVLPRDDQNDLLRPPQLFALVDDFVALAQSQSGSEDWTGGHPIQKNFAANPALQPDGRHFLIRSSGNLLSLTN